MEALLIDIGALAVFLGAVALAYWRGVSHEAQPATRGFADAVRASGEANRSDRPGA